MLRKLYCEECEDCYEDYLEDIKEEVGSMCDE